MKVCVVGLGYIGLPTALSMAGAGVDVIGVDYNKELLATLNAGKVSFEEEGLEELFSKALKNGIEFTDIYPKVDYYVIAVPTPYEKHNKKVDASYVVKAVESVLEVCEDGAVIIIESTISPGTIDKFIRPVVAEKKVHLVHAPERIIPGNMIYELLHNSRTVGADDKEVGERVKALYETFCQGEIVLTDIRTAEMTKVVENTFRDINIAFANELAKICRSADMDVYEVIKIANRHPRVNILSPGPGVGGHCISVDPWFLVGDYPGLANIILAARKINDSMPEFVLKRTYQVMKKHNLKDVTRVGFYGLTYKEDVDDVRESPTLQMIESMEKHLAHGVKVFDPFIKDDLVENQYQDFDNFLNDIDLIVIMVAHSHIKENMDRLKDKVVLDTRHVCMLPGTHRI